MKLYTKKGDDGTTGLFGGDRVPKDHVRTTAYGEVDELNAAIGLAMIDCPDAETADRLRRVQNDLFSLGAELASPEPAGPDGRARQRDETMNNSDRSPRLGDDAVSRLEAWIDRVDCDLPPLRVFVLPGGSLTAARLHLARTVCRRAERAVVALARVEGLRPVPVMYLNRLSDLLFALARHSNLRANVKDLEWVHRSDP